MTHTETPAHEPEEVKGHGHIANADDHHDPLHDIDESKTVWAVLGTLGAVVFLIWAMSHMYNIMVQVERQAKIGDVPPTELRAINKVAEDELAGKHPSRGKMTIDAAINAYIRDSRK